MTDEALRLLLLEMQNRIDKLAREIRNLQRSTDSSFIKGTEQPLSDLFTDEEADLSDDK